MILDSIKIGGIIYKVIVSDDVLTIGGRECNGVISFENATIRLNDNRNPQKVEQTFWHEVVHGIFRERNLDFGDREEDIVESVGIALHQIFVDNFIAKGVTHEDTKKNSSSGNEPGKLRQTKKRNTSNRK